VGAEREDAAGDLVVGPEVEHGAQPEGPQPVEVGAGQPVEPVAAVQPAQGDGPPVRRRVPAEVPQVEHRVEGDVAGRARRPAEVGQAHGDERTERT
jgi:hypothetical protein